MNNVRKAKALKTDFRLDSLIALINSLHHTVPGTDTSLHLMMPMETTNTDNELTNEVITSSSNSSTSSVGNTDDVCVTVIKEERPSNTLFIDTSLEDHNTSKIPINDVMDDTQTQVQVENKSHLQIDHDVHENVLINDPLSHTTANSHSTLPNTPFTNHQQRHMRRLSTPHNENLHSNNYEPSTPIFFADATLDLEEAHGFVDTPDIQHRKFWNDHRAANNNNSNINNNSHSYSDKSHNNGGEDEEDGKDTNNPLINNHSSPNKLPPNILSKLVQDVLPVDLKNIHSDNNQNQLLNLSNNNNNNNNNLNNSIHNNTLSKNNIGLSTTIPQEEAINPNNSNIDANDTNATTNNNSAIPTSNKNIPINSTTTATTHRITSSIPKTQITSSTPPSFNSTNINNNNYNSNTTTTTSNNTTILPTYRPRPPRYPRDIPWTIAAFLFIPTTLVLLPKFHSFLTVSSPNSDNTNNENDDTTTSISNLTQHFLPIFMTCLTSLLLSIFLLGRLLYISPGGGDGEDKRHLASHIVMIGNLLSLFILPCLVLLVYTFYPTTTTTTTTLTNTYNRNEYRIWSLTFSIFMIMTIYEFYMYAYKLSSRPTTTTTPSSSSQTHTRLYPNSTTSISSSDFVDTGNVRRTFFHELVCTALDIVSRSLRYASFYRVICGILVVQFMAVIGWYHAFMKVVITIQSDQFQVDANNDDNGDIGGGGGKPFGFIHFLVIMMVFIGGKWLTGIIIRLLGLIASGGVTSWFAQQSLLLVEMERMKEIQAENSKKQNNKIIKKQVQMDNALSGTVVDGTKDDGIPENRSMYSDADDTNDTFSVDYDVGYNQYNLNMSDAYRSASANTYTSVIDFDDGLDDDYDEDDNDGIERNQNTNGFFVSDDGRGIGSRRGKKNHIEWRGGGSGGGSTVKSFLLSGLSVSFGSVAQCGLLGGLAQMIWAFLREFESFLWFYSVQYRLGGPNRSRLGYRGMSVGVDDSYEVQNSSLVRGRGCFTRCKLFFIQFLKKIDIRCRSFVRNHSDLALCHVAAYFKSYNRAASDVIYLIDISGVEPIIHDDISTHMCSSISKAIAGLLTFLVGLSLSHQQKVVTTNNLSDGDICLLVMISFTMSYTIIYTIMEPLRMSIKALYVCFAQHPQSLSQAFPLVFHRLSRISEANIA